MTKHRLTLDEAPTDVLTYLADRPDVAFTTDRIAPDVAPPGAVTPRSTTTQALQLLKVGGYVTRTPDLTWLATPAGVEAVRVARGPVTA